MNGESFKDSAAPNPETNFDPEVDETLEFLLIYEEIQELMSWLMEKSANSDPVIVAIRRAKLRCLLEQLGLDPEDPGALTVLEKIKVELADRTKHPKPRVDLPEVEFFAERVKEVIKQGGPHHSEYIFGETASLTELAEFGHTNWSKVKSRSPRMSLATYLHGVARIMADPVAYQAQFAELGRGTTDSLTTTREWSIRNGRHRSLATRILGSEYIADAGMSQWIPVSIEE